MCGIAGFIHLNGQAADRENLSRMTDSLQHRGPDNRGVFTDQNVGLGHRRLSVLDLSSAANQPMVSADKNYALVFNGEIYNFADEKLKLEKKGHSFTSSGDTAVLLALYREYGEKCVHYLRGMFAFAIYDKAKQTVFLARDRTGQKPLLYYQNQDTFAFASEQRALRQLPDCPREVDYELLHHYGTLTYIPAPYTGIKNIYTLPSGHTIKIDIQQKNWKKSRYWQIPNTTNESHSVFEWENILREKMEESVKMRLVSDVPLGAFLSGGIDSAMIVSIMSQLSNKPVFTFSLGSKGDKKSELDDAEFIAKYFGTKHTSLEIEPDIPGILAELVAAYDCPFGDPSALPTYLLCKEVSQHVTVALSGDGGDENFGGYVRYPILKVSEWWRRVPHFMRQGALSGATAYHHLIQNTLSYRIFTFLQSAERPWHQRSLQYYGAFTEEEKRKLYSNAMYEYPRTDNWFSQQTKAYRQGESLIKQAMAVDFHTYLPEDLLPKVDLASMAHGLEVRAPFLDHHLLETTGQLPSKLLIRNLQTKWLLRHMNKQMLPPQTLRKKKQGFRIQLQSRFQGDLQAFMESRILAAPPAFWHIFDRQKIEKFLQNYRTTAIDLSSQVWLLLWLAEWLDQQTA